jgi:hypothetical protein
MNDGRLQLNLALRQHFGYGVAKVALAPGPPSGPVHVRPSLADALAALAGEVRSAGLVGSVRKTVTTMGTGLVCGVLLVLVFLVLSRDFQDPDLEIVRFVPEPVTERVHAPPLPVIPDPVPPMPRVAEIPSPPSPRPEPVPEPPPVVPRTPPAPPKPVMPPAPPPPTTLSRVTPQRPAPPPPEAMPRPRVRIDAVTRPAPAPDPAPTPVRATRPELARTRTMAPDLSVDPVATREFRVAKSSRIAPALRRAPALRPTPSSAPSPVSIPDPGSPPPRTSRTTRPAPAPRQLSRRPPGGVPSFAAAPAPASLRSQAPAGSTRSEPIREVSRADSRRADPGDDISGVALGTLAACVSDREEDRLKLAVMAATRNRPECTSRAGRYRFVETKNLNAFLMWIERAESSPPGDRCMELGLALECLQDPGHGGVNRT